MSAHLPKDRKFGSPKHNGAGVCVRVCGCVMCVYSAARTGLVSPELLLLLSCRRKGVVTGWRWYGGGRPGRKLITREDIADERETGIFTIPSHGPEVLDRRLHNDRVRK